MNRLIFKLFAFFLTFSSLSQSFAPAPGNTGTTAIKKDSSIIIGWANGIELTRGLMNKSNPSAGYASYGDKLDAIRSDESTTYDIVSLGDSGVAILTFDRPIQNELGPDFVVFENGFVDNFIELAFVEVSSDGIHFFRFPSTSEAPTNVQIGPFDMSDCRYFNNLAGKYRLGYGTPFDLEELSSTNGLDISSITHVKIIDVIGSLNPLIGSFDSHGTIINDLFPTEFPSGGFDLDAVGVIHQVPLGVVENSLINSIYPNPSNGIITININEPTDLKMIDVLGKEIYREKLFESKSFDFKEFNLTVLFLELTNSRGSKTTKIAFLNN
jgi:hypothetical protein